MHAAEIPFSTAIKTEICTFQVAAVFKAENTSGAAQCDTEIIRRLETNIRPKGRAALPVVGPHPVVACSAADSGKYSMTRKSFAIQCRAILISIKCIGTVSNRNAIGARICVLASIAGQPRWQMREINGEGGTGFSLTDTHFGLEQASIIDSLIVKWPSGIVQVKTNVSVNQHLTITETQSVVTDFTCLINVFDNSVGSKVLSFGTSSH